MNVYRRKNRNTDITKTDTSQIIRQGLKNVAVNQQLTLPRSFPLRYFFPLILSSMKFASSFLGNVKSCCCCWSHRLCRRLCSLSLEAIRSRSTEVVVVVRLQLPDLSLLNSLWAWVWWGRSSFDFEWTLPLWWKGLEAGGSSAAPEEFLPNRWRQEGMWLWNGSEKQHDAFAFSKMLPRHLSFSVGTLDIISTKMKANSSNACVF